MEEIGSNQIAVLIPSYFGSKMLPRVFESLAKQSIQGFKVYVNDNTPSTENNELSGIQGVVNRYSSYLSIDYQRNEENIGYPKNLIRLVNRTSEAYFFVVAQDDVLSDIAIESSIYALRKSPDASVVCRPYYWFEQNLDRPIRHISILDKKKSIVVDTKSPPRVIQHVLVAASQVSGLMYKRAALTEPFVDSIFPAHIYPLAGALRDNGVVFLPFYTVAVDVKQSQTRTISTIYEESPSVAWIEMYSKVFSDLKHKGLRDFGISEHVGKNYVGLIQIRSYGRYKFFLKEIKILLEARPLNFIDPRFMLSFISLALLPRRLIIWLTRNFKTKFLSRSLKDVELFSEKEYREFLASSDEDK